MYLSPWLINVLTIIMKLIISKNETPLRLKHFNLFPILAQSPFFSPLASFFLIFLSFSIASTTSSRAELSYILSSTCFDSIGAPVRIAYFCCCFCWRPSWRVRSASSNLAFSSTYFLLLRISKIEIKSKTAPMMKIKMDHTCCSFL